MRDSRLQHPFDSLGVVVAQIAADGSWISANDALCSLLGYKRDDLTLKRFDTVFQTSAEQAEASSRKRLTSGEISAYTSQSNRRL
jgi:PAS domain S-box-containing protein